LISSNEVFAFGFGLQEYASMPSAHSDRQTTFTNPWVIWDQVKRLQK